MHVVVLVVIYIILWDREIAFAEQSCIVSPIDIMYIPTYTIHCRYAQKDLQMKRNN